MGTIIEIPGRGFLDMSAFRVNKAVNEYDERLYFEMNKENGCWTIFRKMPHGQPDYPVCGFTALPSIEDAIRFLKENDAALHGADKLWDRHMKDLNAERKRVSMQGDDGRMALAEAIEFDARKSGRTKYIVSHSKEPTSKRTGGKN